MAATRLRLQRFLTRNNYPHRVLDTELESGAGPFLECFYITPRRAARGDPAGQPGAAESGDAGAGGRARADRDPGPGAGARRGGDRRRAGRAGDRRLRGLGGPRHDRGREHGAGRAGRHQLEDRELSGLPDRHLRPGAGRAGAGPGAEVRCAARDLARGRRARLRRGNPYRLRAGGRRRDPGPGRGDRHRRALPQARRRELRASSRARASTTPPRPWRRSSAAARRSSWSAAATRPGRRRCSCRARWRTCTSWCARTASPPPCRTIWCSGSCPRPGSPCTRAPRSPRWRATRACASVTWTDRGTGASETRRVGNVFVMIGAEPNTDWLNGCLELDGKGFVVTGQATGLTLCYVAAGNLRGRRRAGGLGQAGGVERRRGVRGGGRGARFPQSGRRLRFATYPAVPGVTSTTNRVKFR